jgi:hypothetical protein
MWKLLGVAVVSLAGGVQQAPPGLPPPPPSPGAGGSPANSLKPGVLPDSATPEARAAWEAICQASLGPDSARAPVRAFELALDVRSRNPSGGTNDVKAEFRYLDVQPGYVRVKFVEGKREVGRGPEGDWLFDGSRNERVVFGVGREYAEDRRQLDEWGAVARLFVSLTDPRSLRLAGLDVLQGAPPGIPATFAKRAGELSWIRARSPDFRLVGVSTPSNLFRASLGWDPKTGRVELALVEEDVAVSALRPTAKLVELRKPQASGGFLVPQIILVYSVEEGRIPPAFTVLAGLDLYVKSSNLRAALQPQDFKLH